MGIVLHYKNQLPKILCEIRCDLTPNGDGTPIRYDDEVELDTGSEKTILPASYLGINVPENEFAKWISDTSNLEFIKAGHRDHHLIGTKFCGVNSKSEPMAALAVQVDGFSLYGTKGDRLDLGGVPIFVSFDKRYQDALLGWDLLSLMNIRILNDIGELSIDLNSRHFDFVKRNGRITPQYFFNENIYAQDIALHSIADIDK